MIDLFLKTRDVLRNSFLLHKTITDRVVYITFLARSDGLKIKLNDGFVFTNPIPIDRKHHLYKGAFL